MAKRLTISIQDSLFDRLEKVKDEIVVSHVCQEALERAVSWQELRSNERGTEMNEIIERLREQKETYQVQFADEARKQGYEDANGMDYEDFMVLRHSRDNLDNYTTYDNWVKPSFENFLEGYPDADQDVFIENYCQGALEFFEEIEGRL